ncbi:MAG: leucine-rich repeat domain-containing protein [Terriglobales bacterium]
MQKDPAARYQSATEVLQDLVETRPAPASQPAPAGTRRGLVLGGVALLGLAMAAAVFFASNQRGHRTPQPAVSSNEPPTVQTKDEKQEARAADLPAFLNQIAKGSFTVDASNFAIVDDDLKELKSDSRLSVLKIDNTQISDKGFKTIGKMKELTAVYADLTRISNAGVRELSNLPKLICLHISTSQNKIDDNCVPSLAKMHELTELTLRDSSITDEGVRGLSGLKKMRCLQLNRTRISDKAIKTIVESYPQLTELHARSNPDITEKSLTYLSKAPHLRYLTLINCSMSPIVMKEFFQKHPQIHDVVTIQENLFLEALDKSEK